MTTMDVFVGIDIGGSHVSVGFVDEQGLVLSRIETPIDNSSILPADLTIKLSDIISTNIQLSWKLKSIGIGIPGQSKNGILVAASNLPNFKKVPLADMISQRHHNIPVALLNDADAAICAEVWGKDSSIHYAGKSNIVMVTLGTGIGCGLILNNTLHQGSNGLIEGGHMIVSDQVNCRKCGCGQTGCVETYSSAKNTAKRLQELDALDTATASGSRSSSKKVAAGVEEMGSKEVFERYALNDFNAVRVVEETAEHLAVFCINLCRVVDPDVIVFGGGMAKAGETLLSLVRKHINLRTWTVLPTDVELATARNVEAAGMLGAALAGKRLYEQTHKPTATSDAAVIASIDARDRSADVLTSFDHKRANDNSRFELDNSSSYWAAAVGVTSLVLGVGLGWALARK